MEERCQFGRSTQAPPCFLTADAANHLAMWNAYFTMIYFIVIGDTPEI